MRLAPTVLVPDPGPAHDWLARELAKPEYRPTVLERFTQWLETLLRRVLEAVSGGHGGPGPLVAIALLVLLVGLVVLVLVRLQANTSGHGGPAQVFTEDRLPAVRHRDLARQAFAEGRWDDAVVESVRAVAAGLLERGLVTDQPGATAHEIAEQSGRLFPGHAERLHAAAEVFDATMYGDRPADEQRAAELLSLEEAVRSSTPVGSAAAAPAWSVPR